MAEEINGGKIKTVIKDRKNTRKEVRKNEETK
jgi:hypothetical protein